MRESLSALMDDEANELEVERVLSRIGQDETLRQVWTRYHAVRDVAAGGVKPAFTGMDISRRVQAAVTAQGGAKRAAPALKQRWARPLGSFAIAASVAAAVVMGGQQIALLNAGSPAAATAGAAVADAAPPGRVFGLEGFSTPLTASFNIGATAPTLQSATPQAYRNLARNRAGRYMQAHAEQAALNSPQGIVPFARVPRIQE